MKVVCRSADWLAITRSVLSNNDEAGNGGNRPVPEMLGIDDLENRLRCLCALRCVSDSVRTRSQRSGDTNDSKRRRRFGTTAPTSS
ncbi:hypothetical protein MRX96_016473 [Rhipicephalus microplus]